MKSKEIVAIVVVALGLMVWLPGSAEAMMDTAFTYQGRLMDADAPADGTYDFQFRLYNTNDPCVGNQQGNTVDINDLDVINGYFTAELDFGSDVFDGDRLWLGIAVRPGDSNDVYTNLIPRQEVTPTPYALYARTAGNALIGSSTTNRIAKFTGPNTLGDSVILELNGHVGIGRTNVLRGGLDVDIDGADIYLDTFSSQVYIGDVDGDGDETLFTVDDSAGKFTFENGNVGIGTENPLNDLHVYDSGNAYVLLESEGGYAFFIADGYRNSGLTIKENGTNKANVYWNTANDCLSLADGSADRLIVKGGNVGIGTTNPGSRLDVKSTGTTADIIRGTASDDSLLFNVQENSGHGVLYVRNDAGSAKVQLYSNGNSYFTGGKVGIGTTSPAVKLHVVGMARVEAIQITGADVAEKFPMSEEVKPGMVVTIDTKNQGQLCLSRGAYNRCVAGVVSGANGLPAGAVLGNLPGQEDAMPIALNGRVWVYCDTTENAIESGDMLTTSSRDGHAMAVTDYTKSHGAVLGKAMTSLEKGQTGLVLTLINLQ